MLAQYQSMAAAEKEEEGEDWWEEGDDGAGRGEAREEVRETITFVGNKHCLV